MINMTFLFNILQMNQHLIDYIYSDFKPLES